MKLGIIGKLFPLIFRKVVYGWSLAENRRKEGL